MQPTPTRVLQMAYRNGILPRANAATSRRPGPLYRRPNTCIAGGDAPRKRKPANNATPDGLALPSLTPTPPAASLRGPKADQSKAQLAQLVDVVEAEQRRSSALAEQEAGEAENSEWDSWLQFFDDCDDLQEMHDELEASATAYMAASDFFF